MTSAHLYYEIHGSGEPLVLLHGNGENSSFFEYQIEDFAGHFQVITVDTRGHGKSERGSTEFTFNQFADDLCVLFDELDIEKADILGFSDGGNIAVVFALKYPGRIKRLVLNGANIFPSGLKPLVHLSVELIYDFFRIASIFSRKAVRIREMYHLMARQPKLCMEELKSIHAPALVLVGTHDLISEKHSKQIAESLPKAEFAKLPGPHAIARTNSSEYNRTVLEFLLKNN